MRKILNFREHVFSYTLAALFIFIVTVSYHRFMISRDYLVGYESECDPLAQSCFTGCEDDKCSEIYYYAHAIKYARDLHTQCGSDITDCEAARVCFPEETRCSITFCEPKEADCESITPGSTTEDEEINLKGLDLGQQILSENNL